MNNIIKKNIIKKNIIKKNKIDFFAIIQTHIYTTFKTVKCPFVRVRFILLQPIFLTTLLIMLLMLLIIQIVKKKKKKKYKTIMIPQKSRSRRRGLRLDSDAAPFAWTRFNLKRGASFWNAVTRFTQNASCSNFSTETAVRCAEQRSRNRPLTKTGS